MGEIVINQRKTGFKMSFSEGVEIMLESSRNVCNYQECLLGEELLIEYSLDLPSCTQVLDQKHLKNGNTKLYPSCILWFDVLRT